MVSADLQLLALKALDDGFSDGLKGMYEAAISKIAGGESVERTLKEFHAGIVMEVIKMHDRLVTEAKAAMEAEA